MRWAWLTLAVAAAMGLAACGGDGESAEPLTLEQRVLLESEAPGSEPDPVEVRVEANGLDEFTTDYVAATQVPKREYEDAGFVAAIHDTRFYPKEPGAEHTGDEAHVGTLVIQFETDEGARTGVDLVHDNGLEPCPGNCAIRVREFEVDGPPDAKGARRYATAEELKETGAMGEPFDSYAIRFSDGPYTYEVEVFGPPGDKVTEQQAETIAQKVYDRVKGAPPPET